MATTAEYGLGEFTFPRGWFVVAEASERVGRLMHGENEVNHVNE